MITITNDKETVAKFKQLIKDATKQQSILKVINSQPSRSYVLQKAQNIKQTTLELLPDSNYSNRRKYTDKREFGKVSENIEIKQKSNNSGLSTVITLNKNIKGYTRAIYFAIIRGYRRSKDGQKIKFKYSKATAKKNALKLSLRRTTGSKTKFLANYIREIFIPQFNKIINKGD